MPVLRVGSGSQTRPVQNEIIGAFAPALPGNIHEVMNTGFVPPEAAAIRGTKQSLGMCLAIHIECVWFKRGRFILSHTFFPNEA
jgi:hypothetical protein